MLSTPRFRAEVRNNCGLLVGPVTQFIGVQVEDPVRHHPTDTRSIPVFVVQVSSSSPELSHLEPPQSNHMHPSPGKSSIPFCYHDNLPSWPPSPPLTVSGAPAFARVVPTPKRHESTQKRQGRRRPESSPSVRLLGFCDAEGERQDERNKKSKQASSARVRGRRGTIKKSSAPYGEGRHAVVSCRWWYRRVVCALLISLRP
jgi:hypothetical protein